MASPHCSQPGERLIAFAAQLLAFFLRECVLLGAVAVVIDCCLSMQMCKDASATKNQRRKPANSTWPALRTGLENRRARTQGPETKNQKGKKQNSQQANQKRVQLQRQNAKYICKFSV